MNYRGSVGDIGREVVDGGDYAGGVEVPLGEEAVGGEIAMEGAGGDSIKIGDVGAGDGTEAIEIEMSVAGFEGIEGPFDESDVSREGFFALEEFEGAADFAIAVFGEDAGHVRVKIGRFIANADDGHGEADHGVSIEGTEDLAAGLIGDDEGDVGFGFEVGFAPDGALELDAAVEVWEGGAFADLDLRGHGEFADDSLQGTAGRREAGGDICLDLTMRSFTRGRRGFRMTGVEERLGPASGDWLRTKRGERIYRRGSRGTAELTEVSGRRAIIL